MEKIVFTAVSYNIHQCIGSDGRRDLDRIVRVIRKMDAQVIGLQEVDSRLGRGSPQFEYLAEALGVAAVAGPAIEHPGGYYGNALFTEFPVIESRCVDISFQKWEPRSVIDAVLDIQGQPTRVVVTHLGLKKAERRYQVQQLLDIVCHGGNDPLVLLADINEWVPLSGRLRTIHECLGKSPGPRTYPSRFPLIALDRIWVRPQKGLRVLHAYRSPLARLASDHLPVRAEIEIERKAL